MKITNLFPWLKFVKGSLPLPLFQCWKQINIHKVFCNIICLGGEGVTTDEKDVFIQIKNSFAKLSHTCIHDCLYFISALKLALDHEEHVSSFLTEFYNNNYYYYY